MVVNISALLLGVVMARNSVFLSLHDFKQKQGRSYLYANTQLRT